MKHLYMLLCIVIGCSYMHMSYRNQIDYCKIVDFSLHYTTINVTIIVCLYIYICIFHVCGSSCRCVRQYDYHSTLLHLLLFMYNFMIIFMKINHFHFPSSLNISHMSA